MRSLFAVTSGFVGVMLLAAACGSSDSSVFPTGSGDGGDGGGGATDGADFGDSTDPTFGDSSSNTDGGDHTPRPITSLAVTPAHAALTVEDGQPPPTQAFQVIATYDDGTTGPVEGTLTWSDSTPQAGVMNATGVFTASGLQGAELTVTAAAGGKTGTATLDVTLHVLRVAGGGSDPGTQTKLRGATAPDAAVKWAYPYDKTVFPRGLNGPELQWIGGADADIVYVHVKSAFYDYESFGPAPKQRFTPGADWPHFVDSTTGDAELTVARLAGGPAGAATVINDQHWSIAPGTMRGTIYYWAIDTGRVMRITPGATNPDDLFAAVDLVPPAKGKCVSCHTVSANGQRILTSSGHWSDTDATDIDQTSVSYDLVGKSISWSGDETNVGGSAFSLAALSADGKVMVQNFMPQNFSSNPVQFANSTGAFDAATGVAIPSTGLEGKKLYTPAFSPDNQVLVYATGGPGDLHAMDWDPVARKATNDRLVVASGSVAGKKYIQYPTVTPDHKYVLYQRGANYGSEGASFGSTSGLAGDLYMAPVAGGGPEVKLAALDGDLYAFAAGNRDRHLDFEPTFAPVASGGKYWVVFHSRRTYGNELTNPVSFGGEGVGVKQLWVAAIDQNVTAGVDPSHPAFHLPGQSLTTFNMRGYWALEPCRGDGAGCGSGTECCGGYCASAGPGAGAFLCAAAPSASSGGCSLDGDRCGSDGDCCKGSGGSSLKCINSVCSVDVVVVK